MSAAALCAVMVVAPTAPAVAGPVFTPGAPGLGDSYYPGYGNGGYDVAHYHLDVRYDPVTDELTGRARIVAKATQNLSSLNFDLIGLTVDSLKVNGSQARWSRTGQELTVTPSRGLRKHVPFTVDVSYHGVPVTFSLPGTPLVAGFMHTDDGAIVAGQPEVAAAWYPVNDHPRDPASYTFNVTVPQGLSALSNGVLLGTSQHAGWTTWRWVQATPMISYLATATIGVFDVKKTIHNGKPTYIAIDPDLPPNFADDAVGRTDEITDFLAQRFGPYPFEANGAIVDDYRQLFFALENQTKSIYSRFFFAEGVNEWETFVVAHELAHQWFGDSVAVNQWRDIWLNEGFATYAEWLWSEQIGFGTPQEIFDALYAEDVSEPFWSPPPGDPGVDFLFAESVYTRGAMTVQALRQTVGDGAFWSIVRRWASEHRGSTGSTTQFIDLAEEVSGQQLDELFDAWLFTPGKPAYPGVTAAQARSQAAAVPYLNHARNYHQH